MRATELMDAMAHTSKLCIDLSNRIRAYKKEHPNLSGTQVAKRFNMSTSSLNRVENCDVRMPAIDQIIKILRGTGAKGDLLKYLDEHYPIIAETYREVYSSRNNKFVDLDLEYYLHDKEKFIIITLALIGNGTTRDEISREFGNKGLIELNYLLDMNLLKEVNGIIGNNDDSLNTSFSTLKSLLSNSVDQCFDTSGERHGYNYISYRAVRVNREKVTKKIIGILKDAEIQINDLINDPEFSGNDDLFYGLVTDSLISYKLENSHGGLQ